MLNMVSEQSLHYTTIQEAHGLQLAHLSGTTTADMQMACKIYPIPSNIETYDKAMAQTVFEISCLQG